MKIPPHLTTIINKHDPLGLIALGCPEDEYDPEAETILEKLNSSLTREEVLDIVYDEFVYWFGTSAGSKDEYGEMSKEIHQWFINKLK